MHTDSETHDGGDDSQARFANLLQNWPPADPNLLLKIRQGLANGVYVDNRTELIAELKKDVSLYLYCIRAIGVASGESSDATALMRSMPLDELERLISADAGPISIHSIESGSPEHKAQLMRSMVSATVAESISNPDILDPEFTFTYALLRQLGLSLIAWTYPSLYLGTIANKKEDEDLDALLTDSLGFSPSLMGVRMAQEWGIYCDPSPPDAEATPQAALIAQTLTHVCEIGEAFAADTIPEGDYPPDWTAALRAVEEIVGEQGIASLKETLTSRLSQYLACAPELFQWNASNIRPHRKKVELTERLANNVYIRHCTQSVQEALFKLYSSLPNEGTIYLQGIRLVTKELMALSGFAGGAILLIDTHQAALVPRFSFGEFPPALNTKYRYADNSPQAHPFVLAFRSNAPIITREEPENGSKGAQIIIGVLGETQRTGVLVLIVDEIATATEPLASHSVVLAFKALRQAIGDCLNIY